MADDVRLLASARAIAVGVGGCVFLAASTVGSFVIALTDYGLRLERRLGSAYFVGIGMVGVVITAWLSVLVGTALAQRDQGLVRVVSGRLEVQTSRGRCCVPVAEVSGVGLAGGTGSLEIRLRDGRILRPILRPDGGNWDQHLQTLGPMLEARDR